ncbi:MAG: hypothetical protein IJ525_01270 [Alphaproteobacteria bacterium]|nr:hypothetical protein [Alphaproteobacteria bacterium]
MINLEIKNIKSHPSLSLAKAKASRDLQINFNQAEDALTIPAESKHDYKCGSATQSGRSMIEMLGVLAIIGVLSVGGIAGYSKAMMKYRINKTIEQITLIAGNVRAFWGPQGNYNGFYCDCSSESYDFCSGQANNDGCPIIKKAKLLPDEMLTIDSTTGKITNITNAFGGLLWTKDLNYGGFILEFRDIPTEACIDIITQNWKDVKVENIGVANGAGRPDVSATPIDIDTAINLCQHGDHNNLHFQVESKDTSWLD